MKMYKKSELNLVNGMLFQYPVGLGSPGIKIITKGKTLGFQYPVG